MTQRNSPPTQHTEPSHQFPTREYLEKNFNNKPHLQKWCRELGLSKVWVPKAELVNMILQDCKPKPQASDEENLPPPLPGDPPPATGLDGNSQPAHPQHDEPEAVITPCDDLLSSDSESKLSSIILLSTLGDPEAVSASSNVSQSPPSSTK